MDLLAAPDFPLVWDSEGAVPTVSVWLLSDLTPLPLAIADNLANTGVFNMSGARLRAAAAAASMPLRPGAYTLAVVASDAVRGLRCVRHARALVRTAPSLRRSLRSLRRGSGPLPVDICAAEACAAGQCDALSGTCLCPETRSGVLCEKVPVPPPPPPPTPPPPPRDRTRCAGCV
jgi:hypothetical protein